MIRISILLFIIWGVNGYFVRPNTVHIDKYVSSISHILMYDSKLFNCDMTSLFKVIVTYSLSAFTTNHDVVRITNDDYVVYTDLTSNRHLLFIAPVVII